MLSKQKKQKTRGTTSQLKRSCIAKEAVNNKEVNLLEGNESLLVRKKILQANKKQDDYYKLVITAKEDIGKDKKITLKIFSE